MTIYTARFDWHDEFERPCKSDPDPVLSDGEDLKTDFEDALSGSFRFSGNYFHCHTDTCSPNPGLKIDGVGSIGLPLSERDAQAFISVATPIRVSEEEEEDVQGAWEIAAAHVDFQNAKWESYLAKNAILTACETLGVGQLTHVKPQCELDKVVLLEASESQFVLSQGGYHEKGIFATVAIILSSSFEGGQLHISHSEQDVLLDISENSAFSTSIIAWYNEAALEIFPVTSGYRLALMYNLIHPCPDSPQPSLLHPSIDSADLLPEVLRRWKEGKYRQMPSSRVLVCPLAYNYRELDLKHGVSILERPDADKVGRILPHAEKYGFTVCLANAESDGIVESSWKPELECYSVFNLVSLTADRNPYFESVNVYDDSIVLDRNHTPQSSVSGGLTQRTVLLIFRDEDEAHLTITSQSIDQTLRRIRHHDAQNPTAKQIAYGLLPTLQPAKSDVPDPRTLALALAARDLMDLALSWGEVDLWIGAFPYSDGPLKYSCGELRKALRVFDVKSLHVSITELLRRTPQLQSRIRIIEVVTPYLSDEVGPRWADTAMSFVLSIYEEANLEDIPILLELARRRFGLGFIWDSVIPNILHQPQPNMCSFFATLAGALHQSRSLFTTTISPKAPWQPSVEDVIRQAMDATISSSGLTVPPSDPQYLDLDGIFNLVGLCFTVTDPESTIPLFNAILQSTASLDTAESFDKVYTPILQSHLKSIQHKYGCKLTLEPLCTFLQNVVSQYLTNILDSKPDAEYQGPKWTGKKVGCGCDDCILLDAFIENPVKLKSAFKMREDRRRHLESRIDARASTFLTYWTMKSGCPYTLNVSKREEALKENVRKQKRERAFGFLESVGGSLEEVERVMGRRWVDVVDACEGRAGFEPVLGGWAVKVEENVPGGSISVGGVAVNAKASVVIKRETKQEVKQEELN